MAEGCPWGPRRAKNCVCGCLLFDRTDEGTHSRVLFCDWAPQCTDLTPSTHPRDHEGRPTFNGYTWTHPRMHPRTHNQIFLINC
eukprot:gene21558-biopygen11679